MARSKPGFWRGLWRPDRPWYRQRALVVAALPALLVAFGLVVVFVYLFASVPLPEDIVAEPTLVLDRNGTEVATLSPEAARSDVSLDALPEHVPQAVMAAEDRNFFEHRGISITGTLRALVTNVRAGDIEQGGSTITQQYIKNAALTSERTFTRKAKEAVLAVKLERQHDKETILEFYLNTIYWGRGAYGIEAAAQTYFGVTATELDVNQAATLAGIIRAPERFDPTDDPGAANIRREYVLDGMVAEGWLDQDRAQQFEQQGLPDARSRQTVDHGPAAYYLDAVRRELADEIGGERIFRGLTITTEMDLGAQEFAQRIVSERVDELRAQLAENPPAEDFDVGQLSGALVSIEPERGGVRALVGGPDFARQQLNAAIATGDNGQGLRQAGSAFKPFALAGFVDEGHSPESRFPAPSQIEDVEFPDGRVYEGPVHNFGNRGFGTQTVREGTLTSTNTVYVQIAAEIGADKVVDMAVRAGIPDRRLEPNPSLVLGTSGVSVLEMTHAFSTFAGGGVRVEPRFVRRVEDRDGGVVFEQGPESEPAFDSNVAYVVSDILEQNIQSGTGTRAQIGRPAAGKTGTTQDSNDAWFVGYVPQLTTGVWFGHLGGDAMGDVTGGSIPAETWGEFMAEATANFEVVDFPSPDYSGLDRLNEAPSPGPGSPTPTATETEECPEDPADVDDPEDLPEGCPTPAPTPTQTATASPTPSPTDESTASPSPDDDGEQSPSPTPTETTDDEDGGDSDSEAQSRSSPSPSPS